MFLCFLPMLTKVVLLSSVRMTCKAEWRQQIEAPIPPNQHFRP